MAITHSTRNNESARRSINAGTNINSGVVSRQAKSNVMANTNLQKLSPEKQRFARQLAATSRRNVMAATNTSNIMAKPDFLEMLPMFVQKLLVLDVFGSVAMNSRQQLIPYFKFVADNTKGETSRNTVLSSPFINNQGKDFNFTGRVVKNEGIEKSGNSGHLAYGPVLPGSVTITMDGAKYTDNGNGEFVDNAGAKQDGMTVDYFGGSLEGLTGDEVIATYQYDNEAVLPETNSHYGAQMAKGSLQLDEINLVAEAREIACYWSIYAAFAANKEYGANIADMGKEAAISELTAEINSYCFDKLRKAAAYKPQFNWDASPVLAGSVVPSDYLNMFKLKLGQAAAAVYQETRLSRPNRLIVGSTAAEYIAMINGFQAENIEDTVGPYKFGKLDQFEIFVEPNYDPNMWVMCCKSNDIRRNTGLFGEYMPITTTDPIGLANASVQQGAATMMACEIVVPETVVSGRILGTF